MEAGARVNAGLVGREENRRNEEVEDSENRRGHGGAAAHRVRGKVRYAEERETWKKVDGLI